MTTFLEAVNRLAVESAVSNAAASVATVVNQVGMAARFVNWIRSAHTDIQRRHQNWRWMRSQFNFNTTAGDDSYAGTDATDSILATPITRFARWIPLDDNGFSNILKYLTSAGVPGQTWLIPISWPSFITLYKRGTQTNGAPVHFTIDPQNNLVLGPKPDAIYTISGEYQKSALIFAADDDAMEFPQDFHDLVWLTALEKYGRAQSAGEALARAIEEGGRMMRRLEGDQLPQMMLGQPLV